MLYSLYPYLVQSQEQKSSPLVLSIRPRLRRSAVCNWMMWYNINSLHSFITCVIAIDLPEAVSGGLELESFTCHTSGHIDMLYKSNIICPCLESQ